MLRPLIRASIFISSSSLMLLLIMLMVEASIVTLAFTSIPMFYHRPMTQCGYGYYGMESHWTCRRNVGMSSLSLAFSSTCLSSSSSSSSGEEDRQLEDRQMQEQQYEYIAKLEGVAQSLNKQVLEKDELISMLRDELTDLGRQYSNERRLRDEESSKLLKVREEMTRQLIATRTDATKEQTKIRGELEDMILRREGEVRDLQQEVFQLEQQMYQFQAERGNLRSMFKILLRLLFQKFTNAIGKGKKRLGRRLSKLRRGP